MHRAAQMPLEDSSLNHPPQSPGERRDLLPPVFRGSQASSLVWSGIFIVLIALVDWRDIDDLPLGFLYLLPMLMLGRVLKPWQTLIVALLCTWSSSKPSSQAAPQLSLPRTSMAAS